MFLLSRRTSVFFLALVRLIVYIDVEVEFMESEHGCYGIVYRATNERTGKMYIGQTTMGLSARRRGHERGNTRGFGEAISLYGTMAFSWDILAWVNSRRALDRMEVFYISNYNTMYPNGYNMVPGNVKSQAPLAPEKPPKELPTASFSDPGWDKIIERAKKTVAKRIKAQKEGPTTIYELVDNKILPKKPR